VGSVRPSRHPQKSDIIPYIYVHICGYFMAVGCDPRIAPHAAGVIRTGVAVAGTTQSGIPRVIAGGLT
jgi:hypothetical protein